MTYPQAPPPVGQTVWSGPSPDGSAPTPQGATLRRSSRRDPLSIVLITVIVVAVVAAGLLAGELIARTIAGRIATDVTECVVQDEASVSFGPRPLLWQAVTGDYSHLSMSTAGNQIREAKGMKADIYVDDVRLNNIASSQGTIGALDATITWSADGIKQTVQESIPLLGAFVTGVTTNPNDGTIELEGALGSITARPRVVNNGIGLQVVGLTGLGLTLPRETLQPALDIFTTQLTDNYPLGIKADDVRVTDSGVTARFSARNAEIPQGIQNPCFSYL